MASGIAEDPNAAFPEIAQMRYEDAREELIAIVAKLEAGQVPLEDSMQLWRRGEALAAHCSTWLDGAQAEIEGATRERDATSSKGTGDGPPQDQPSG
ncbi:exodeoxyribonuclease VII small subunit [Intrasporangium sp.]|jgi:exodeoxyribonuclease VII small subunit|uniref:exodeoxyribonuclease VII small subunit n=1 Tax=Intrasporangium sp. TaxID=1925024 RepID=UPI0033656BCC